MLDKLFKMSVIIIAGFVVAISIIFLFGKYSAPLTAQTTNATSGYAIPESHVWEVAPAGESAGFLYNKLTGESYYVSGMSKAVKLK